MNNLPKRAIFALGIDDYSQHNIPQLDYAAISTKNFYEVMLSADVGNCDIELSQCFLLTNKTNENLYSSTTQPHNTICNKAEDISFEGVYEHKLKQFMDEAIEGKCQTIVAYFCGHGTVKNNTFYLQIPCARSKMGYLDLHSVIKKCFENPALSYIIIIDSCYSGKMLDGSLSTRSAQMEGIESLLLEANATGKIIMTSASERDMAYESSQLENTIYTHYLIDNLTKYWDRTEEFIKCIDIQTKVEAKVRYWINDQVLIQKESYYVPNIKHTGGGRGLSLAKNPNHKKSKDKYRKEVMEPLTSNNSIWFENSTLDSDDIVEKITTLKNYKGFFYGQIAVGKTSFISEVIATLYRQQNRDTQPWKVLRCDFRSFLEEHKRITSDNAMNYVNTIINTMVGTNHIYYQNDIGYFKIHDEGISKLFSDMQKTESNYLFVFDSVELLNSEEAEILKAILYELSEHFTNAAHNVAYIIVSRIKDKRWTSGYLGKFTDFEILPVTVDDIARKIEDIYVHNSAKATSHMSITSEINSDIISQLAHKIHSETRGLPSLAAPLINHIQSDLTQDTLPMLLESDSWNNDASSKFTSRYKELLFEKRSIIPKEDYADGYEHLNNKQAQLEKFIKEMSVYRYFLKDIVVSFLFDKVFPPLPNNKKWPIANPLIFWEKLGATCMFLSTDSVAYKWFESIQEFVFQTEYTAQEQKEQHEEACEIYMQFLKSTSSDSLHADSRKIVLIALREYVWHYASSILKPSINMKELSGILIPVLAQHESILGRQRGKTFTENFIDTLQNDEEIWKKLGSRFFREFIDILAKYNQERKSN